MKLQDKLDLLAYSTGPDGVELASALVAILRRDWAVRVLDAWVARETVRPDQIFSLFTGVRGGWVCGLQGDLFNGPTPDAARHAAALAVFPTLSAEKQAELGECP